MSRPFLSRILSVVNTVPTLFLLFLVYNLLVYTSHRQASAVMGSVQLRLPLHGAPLEVTTGDLLVLVGVVLLFFEVVKSTVASNVAILEHGLSTLTLTLFLVELILAERAATSTFLILTTMQLADVVSGFAVGIIAARRDMGIHYYT